MGNESTKSKKNSRLTSTEKNQIIELLSGFTNGSKGVNRNVIEELWRDDLVPSLLEQYVNYLCPSPSTTCDVEEFAELYVNLVRASSEEKADTLLKIISSNSDNRTVPYSVLSKYVSDVLESYILGLENRDTQKYCSWRGRFNSSLATHKLSLIVDNWCALLDRKSKAVSVEQIEEWLNSCGALRLLHQLEMEMLYGLVSKDEEENNTSLLPLLSNANDLGVTQSILTPGQILHLNYLLPLDCQDEWRYLFSTTHHGESFSMLLGKLLDKGPCVLVLSDEKDNVFGGFASASWTLSPKFQGDAKCFLFTLQPQVQVFQSTGYNDHYMYLNYNQQSLPNGLGMGGQFNYWGLWLDAEFGDGMCSDTCTTFRDYKMLSWSKKFHVKHLEIWGVGPAPLTESEKGERSTILDKDPTARVILELAGKKEHSAGLRDKPSSTGN